jgi:adenine-specific DNA-methyltransferase
VGEKVANELLARGLRPGDGEFEAEGICESVTYPRSKSTILGTRPDGLPISGQYLDGPEMSQGFLENFQYFKLDFLDPNAVAYGESFEAILPILWLMSGAQGEIETARGFGKYFIPKQSPYAVLIKEDAFASFKRELAKRPDITHVFLITDSEEAYREMLADLPGKYTTRMLYKSYLDNFKINLEPPS